MDLPSNYTAPLHSKSETLGFSYTYLLYPILFYPILCALLRHHRLRQTLEEFPYTTRKTFASMTNEDAFHIQQNLTSLEFPFTCEKALQFALFRTYGIPSISSLLAHTEEFCESSKATKRYADTVVLIAEFMGYKPGEERSVEAIGRMNYIHSVYQKAGKISNDDLLYTLSLFAWEPVRWVERCEWRDLEDFEKAALGTFWKGVGDAMGIDFRGLKSAEVGWRDGLEWLEEVGSWAEEYESRCMVPKECNRVVADQTVEILLWHVPRWGKGVGRKVVCALMDERLRNAMMYEKPENIYLVLVSLIFAVRKLFLRFLFMPRPYILRYHLTTEEPSKENTYFLTNYEAVPWYIKPTLWNRHGPFAWISWLRGVPLPGDGGEKYWPKGYRIEQIGPSCMRGKGAEYWRESKEKLTRERMKGCPFGRSKKE